MSISASSLRGFGSKRGRRRLGRARRDRGGSSAGAAALPPPKPVAITVTRTSSPSDSSITAPKITFAFGSAWLVTTSAASLTSNRPMSGGR